MTLIPLLLAFFILLLLPLYIVYKPPHFLIRYFTHRWPDVLWHVPTTSKTIALTIDDAPSQYTPEILSVLAAHHATATFFIIGSQAEAHRDLLTDMVRRGHDLANHAMHDEPSRSLPSSALLAQLSTVQDLIDTAYASANRTAPATRYFRPGSGFFSSRMRKVVSEHNYQIALGSIYPHDPQIPYAWLNARHVLSMIRPGGIVICHDRRPWTGPMLRKVLPEAERRGFAVTSLAGLVQAGKEG